MYILNYIYFLIITLCGLNYLYSPRQVVLHPYNKRLHLKLDGPEMFWILTFSTGLFALSAPAGLDLMAVRLLVLEIFCFIGLFLSKGKVIWALPIILYLLYILWMVLGLFYSPSPSYGIRVIMKYMYPLIVMMFASSVVRDGELFLKASLGMRKVALLSLIFILIPFLERSVFPGVLWYSTARAIHYIAVTIFSLALFFYGTKSKKDLLISFLFMLPCVIWVFRTSIMGVTLALMLFFFIRYRIKALPVIGLVFVMFIVSIFTIPSVRDKMFFSSKGKSIEQLQAGKISAEDINSNGRFAMWEWSLKKFYQDKKLTGTGTGNLQETFYELRHPFGTIKICHNDYVQILCDNGLVGLVLFGSSFFALIFHCFVVCQKKKYPWYILVAAITAASSAGGMLLTLFTDNGINYSMATISYPCGFYGMMLGLIAGYKNKVHNVLQ